LEDVAATVDRPVVSASTNGTLIDEAWAERIVRLPFSNLTISIDGGTPATYARMRQGADLGQVLDNVRRIQRWKEKVGSQLPQLDSFFVVMRSNFREIPQYLNLMRAHGFAEVALQTAEINDKNTSREPWLVRDEVIAEPSEIRELYALMVDLVPRERRHFRMIRTSGLTSLFESQGLDCSFLREAVEGLYPNSDDLSQNEPIGIPLCPNPWTTMFVVENGDVHLCFLSEPVGNLYEMPLAAIWNCQQALAKRSDMISGRYLESGCSERWCSWREGKKAAPGNPAGIGALREEIKQLVSRAAGMQPLVQIGQAPSGIAAVRRMLAARDGQVRELEAMFAQVCEKNAAFHEKGQQYIHTLEARLSDMQTRNQQQSAAFEKLDREYRRLKRTFVVRAAGRISRLFSSKRLACQTPEAPRITAGTRT
jgi:MoaA/NifB/PqqE/SkfB family radical SAM enzyme